jgi:hypothetical protein
VGTEKTSRAGNECLSFCHVLGSNHLVCSTRVRRTTAFFDSDIQRGRRLNLFMLYRAPKCFPPQITTTEAAIGDINIAQLCVSATRCSQAGLTGTTEVRPTLT